MLKIFVFYKYLFATTEYFVFGFHMQFVTVAIAVYSLSQSTPGESQD